MISVFVSITDIFSTSSLTDLSKTIKEFRIIFKYLAFVACAAKAPITQKLLDETLSLIDKAGSAENIRRWYLWTPTQLSLMEIYDKLKRVVLIGGNGTGKTLMLETYVINTANENPKDDVVFAIHLEDSFDKPLLQLQFEVKFEELSNVTVKTFINLDELSVENCENTHICIDEVDASNIPLEDLQKIHAKSIWIVIRTGSGNQKVISKEITFGNHEEYLKKQIPGWLIVNLTYPLRTSKRISIKVKETGFIGGYDELQNDFNSSLEIVENMPLGPEPLVILSSKGTYKERLQHVFNTVAKDKSALIIFDYEGVMSPTPSEVEKAEHSSTNEESQSLLLGIEAVKACDRPKPPLIWLDYNHDDINNDKEDIKAMMRGSKDFIGCDLITSPYTVAGIEADVVIFVGSYVSSVTDIMSRCRGQFVHVPLEGEDSDSDSICDMIRDLAETIESGPLCITE